MRVHVCFRSWYSVSSFRSLFFFFFNDTATTEIYTLSLHDALPISPAVVVRDAASLPVPNVAVTFAVASGGGSITGGNGKGQRWNPITATTRMSSFFLKKKKKKPSKK